eukprot:COSAG03_NODE_15966_length_415_cov_0.958861_1_plen_103_part_01
MHCEYAQSQYEFTASTPSAEVDCLPLCLCVCVCACVCVCQVMVGMPYPNPYDPELLERQRFAVVQADGQVPPPPPPPPPPHPKKKKKKGGGERTEDKPNAQTY